MIPYKYMKGQEELNKGISMTHEDRGHYAEKHTGIAKDKKICSALSELSDNDKITCSAIHRIARNHNIVPETVGVQADLMELRLIECQLGLFGYETIGKKLDPDVDISPALNKLLRDTGKNGRISCVECWDIAARLKIKKNDVGNACEKLGLRIKPCQIGAF